MKPATAFPVRISTSTGLVFALAVLSTALSCRGKRYEVARLKISTGEEVLIQTDYYYENNRKYYYDVLAKGTTKVPTTFICAGGDPDKLRFEIVPGRGSVIAVVESRRPTEVLMLYDSGTGESWPHAQPAESSEDQKNKGLKLLQKLMADKSTGALKLGDQECG